MVSWAAGEQIGDEDEREANRNRGRAIRWLGVRRIKGAIRRNGRPIRDRRRSFVNSR